MINSPNRLRGRREPRIVMKHGKSARSGVLGIKYLQRGEGAYQAVVVVSKKVTKVAPLRNRIRRRVYEQLRTNFKIKDGYKLVISVFDKQLSDVTSQELHDQLRELLRKTPLLD